MTARISKAITRKDRKMIENVVRKIVLLLVHGEFEKLENMKMLGPSTREEYALALRKYLRGHQVLCEPPPEAFSELEVGMTRDAKRWRVDFALWTDLGRSDLTAQIYVEEVSPGGVRGMLYDLRVL
ncbi:hypothetical protein [Paraburkholderia sp. 22B1P]|uniref:DUF7668 domain-containing protein n=1 Tax=Paraburkholderia sp. 22B1P TaxID=3080498 RepID=UPI00308ED4C6|nr:hypothetical protein PBP221_72620 [Paraburkholderia sp. 22B1P]